MFACLIVQLLPSPLRMHVFPTNLLEIECPQNRMRNTLFTHHLASLWMCRCRSATARSNPRCTNTVRDWRRSCQRDIVNMSQHCGHHNSLSRNDLISIVFLMSCKILYLCPLQCICCVSTCSLPCTMGCRGCSRSRRWDTWRRSLLDGCRNSHLRA